ncbi:jg9310, partial [Pararge aegeria aegeria]
EDPCISACRILSQHLTLTQLSPASVSRCHRLGGAGGNKPRAILIKFRDCRHKIFLAARQRFGVAKCWTRDGIIMVLDSGGKRHRITTLAELNAISNSGEDVPSAAIPAAAPTDTAAAPKDSKLANRELKEL